LFGRLLFNSFLLLLLFLVGSSSTKTVAVSCYFLLRPSIAACADRSRPGGSIIANKETQRISLSLDFCCAASMHGLAGGWWRRRLPARRSSPGLRW
jgi:hypothetical protein